MVRVRGSLSLDQLASLKHALPRPGDANAKAAKDRAPAFCAPLPLKRWPSSSWLNHSARRTLNPLALADVGVASNRRLLLELFAHFNRASTWQPLQRQPANAVTWTDMRGQHWR